MRSRDRKPGGMWLDQPRNPKAPLAGLKVLELARVLAGPWAGQILADLGADVIKLDNKSNLIDGWMYFAVCFR